MDLEQLEALALGDRAAALAALLAGTVEHDYWHGVALQHEGRLDEADELLATFGLRHGQRDALFLRLERRQALLRAGRELAPEVLAQLRRWGAAQLNHQPEVAAQQWRYPSRLDPALVDEAAIVASRLGSGSDLSRISDWGLRFVLAAGPLAKDLRRELLRRLGPWTALPELVTLIGEDLVERSASGFGELAVHRNLTLAQLEALPALRPALRQTAKWVDAVLARLAPGPADDVQHDLAQRAAWLERLWAFASTLPASMNGLRSHILLHQLELARRAGRFDRDRLLAYLELPRHAAWTRPERIKRAPSEAMVADGGGTGRAAGLEPIYRDREEQLVREHLAHFLLSEDGSAFAELVEGAWLEQLLAETRLLAGLPETERWAAILGPGRLAALRERVDLELGPENPRRFRAHDPVALTLYVKHVRELLVKVFRIEPVAYFLAKGGEVDTSLDLDGMIASHEEVVTIDAPAIERRAVVIPLPRCAAPGTYIVELIGAGRSSRALIRKGALRHSVRVGAAGPVVTVRDEAGRALRDASLWLGGREHRPKPDGDGSIVVPFSTRPGLVTMLLVHGDVAQVATLLHPAETYQLSAGIHLERESLVPGRSARILVRPTLSAAGWPASVKLLEEPQVELAVTDLAGTTSTRTEPVTLADDAETVVELRVLDGVQRVSLRLRGRVRQLSQQATLTLEDGIEAAVDRIHASAETEALHLATTPEGHRLSLLGKSGEARPGRAIALTLEPRAARDALSLTLETDAAGDIELGALPGVLRLTARLASGTEQSWSLAREPEVSWPPVVQALAGASVTLAAPEGPFMLMQVVDGQPIRDVTAQATVERGALVIAGLGVGSYLLRALAGRRDWDASPTVAITIAPRPPEPDATPALAVVGEALLELSREVPLVRASRLDDDALTLELGAVGPATRVHVWALRFRSDPALPSALARPAHRPLAHPGSTPLASYVSGREIGDEYRYVLERRRAARRPGTMLEKPGLLLNPWALRSTATTTQDARGGKAYAMAGDFAPPPPPAPAPMPKAAPTPALGGFASLDFLAAPAVVLANLRPDAAGRVHIARATLGEAQLAHVVVVDASGTSTADVPLGVTDPASRDLRLRLALDATRHYREDRAVVGAPAGTALVVDDVRTGRIELVDSVARAHQVLATLGLGQGQDALAEMAFVASWHALDEAARRDRYSRYACHELHLFLARKDPPFFAAVVRPYLAHKRHKTFVDRWLLGEDLGAWLEPWAFGRLNTLERILLGLRHPELAAGIARLVGDAAALLPPDPERDARAIATLLGTSALEAPSALSAERDEAVFEEKARPKKRAARRADMDDAQSMLASRAAPPAAAAGPGGGGGGLAMDLLERESAEPLYRAADKTQEWAESDWWHRPIAEVGPELIAPNRFWRDLAEHAARAAGAGATPAPFLSPWLADCTGSFAEAMAALAFLDLPLAAASHTVEREDTRLSVTLASHALAARTRIVEVEAGDGASGVLVGQTLFRADDRWEWDGAEQREKPVRGELVAGIVYQCQVVVTNPTSGRQKLEVLLQIPRGAIPVSSGFVAKTVHVDLGGYGTHALEYAFYFPRAGRWSHFPAHVTRAGALVAAAPPRDLEVRADPAGADPGSWAEVSQHGSLDDVLTFLAGANPGRVDLGKIAWRMRERAAFERVTAALAARHLYDDRLWAYALSHADRARTAEWLRHRDDVVRTAGPLDDGALVALDAVERGWYQHLEYAPLVAARAHQLGGRRVILNDGLAAQYRAFLELVAHRAAPTADDLLAAAHYLFALDRPDDALAMLARVDPARVATRLQYDYLAAYAAACRGDLGRARELAAPWLDHPVDRWRARWQALAVMLDEAAGGGPARPTSPDSRDQALDAAAARQPALDLSVVGDAIVLAHHRLERCQLRFHRLDLELLFSRQPFVQGDVERFSWVEPGLTLEVALDPSAGRTTVPLPPALVGKNLVIEALAPGLRKAVAHYAHDLAVQLVAAYGQVRVLRASTQAALPATYVKVFGRQRDGRVAFYKDGYTDARGRFDYATLSTDDLDRVERFALLVVSDEAGAIVLEAAPPAR